MLKIRKIVEVVLGLGSVVGLSWWIPEAWRESHLIFCAFFIVVFAIAVRYYTLAAYGTSVLAALCYGLLLWLHPEMRTQPHFLYVALEPSLLLASGICASDILRWQRQRLQTLEQDYARTEQALREITGRYQRVFTNETMEQSTSEQSTSAITLSEKIARLWKLDGDRQYSAALDLVISALEAQSCSLYLQQKNVWYLHSRHSKDDVVDTPVLNMDDPLIKRVIEQGEVSTVLDALSEKNDSAREMAIMAGPLQNEVGSIVGIVVIDNISLLKFTPGTTRLFRSLLSIISASLHTARFAARDNNYDLVWSTLDTDQLTSPVPTEYTENMHL